MKRLLSVIALALAVSFAINAQEKESVETDVNQYGQVVKTVPVQGNLQDGILVFQNKKQNYKMWFDVRIQADAAAFFGAPDFCAKQLDGKDNTNHIGNGMNIRRARFAVKAQLDKTGTERLILTGPAAFLRSRMPSWLLPVCRDLN